MSQERIPQNIEYTKQIAITVFFYKEYNGARLL